MGSNLYRVGVHELVTQKILRHSNGSTTTTYYIKSTSKDVLQGLQGMEKLEHDSAERLELEESELSGQR